MNQPQRLLSSMSLHARGLGLIALGGMAGYLFIFMAIRGSTTTGMFGFLIAVAGVLFALAGLLGAAVIVLTVIERTTRAHLVARAGLWAVLAAITTTVIGAVSR